MPCKVLYHHMHVYMVNKQATIGYLTNIFHFFFLFLVSISLFSSKMEKKFQTKSQLPAQSSFHLNLSHLLTPYFHDSLKTFFKPNCSSPFQKNQPFCAYINICMLLYSSHDKNTLPYLSFCLFLLFLKL